MTQIFKSVSDYVSFFDGKRPIEKVLIANNGIAAVKCMRSIRNWCFNFFNSERMVKFLVMATPEDLKANAEYIRMADMVEEVPGGSNANNYKNVNLILDIATKRGVDGVWAGWGHASEDPALPTALSKAGIAFMGPPAKPMRDLGDKIASTLLAQSANVSCIAWSGSGLTLDYKKDGINQDIFEKACCQNVEQAEKAVKNIGFPVMIKASEGGGGKGIRMVNQQEDLVNAFRQVQGEVPESPIFIMKMVSGCRHLEVQLLADQYNNAIALFGRDCSIQRRHQKIIEEGPPKCPPETWKEMEQAAVRLANLVGYEGVGTIEYLYDAEKNKYYFLELNPRLQVEHPVTELITDVNLPACQLQVAMGIRLDRIPYIRKFYLQKDLFGKNEIDFYNSKRRNVIGHTIACRITGENPDEGFKPTSGAIQELTFRSAPKTWGYFSVGASGGIHEFADSQFGHIFASGETREEARREMLRALRQISIVGDISTTVAYLCHLLETKDFIENRISTQWLDGLIAKGPREVTINPWLVIISGVLYKAFSIVSRKETEYVSYLQRGQVPPKDLIPLNSPSNPINVEVVYRNTKYIVNVLQGGYNKFILFTNSPNHVVECEVRSLGDGGLLILIDDNSHVCYGNENITGTKLILDGQTFLLTADYDPTELRATTAGKLIQFLVDNNSNITAGTPFAEIEVMKMYMQLSVTENGTIRFAQTPGNVISVGSLLATLDLEDPSKVKRADLYQGEIPKMRDPITKGKKLNQKLQDTLTLIRSVLAGFYYPFPNELADNLFEYLYDPLLPTLEFSEAMKKVSPRFPQIVSDKIINEIKKIAPEDQSELKQGHQRKASFSPEYIAKRIDGILKTHEASLSPEKKGEFANLIIPLHTLCEKYENGVNDNVTTVLSDIFNSFLQVEKNYHRHRDRYIQHLRTKFKDDLKEIYTIDRAQINLAVRSKLVTSLLNKIQLNHIGSFTTLLTELSELKTPDQTVSVTAKQMLIRTQLPTFEQRKVAMEKDLVMDNLQPLIEKTEAIVDVLTDFLSHSNEKVRTNAMNTYLRRTYRAYEMGDLISTTEKSGDIFSRWWFQPHWMADSNYISFLKNSLSQENMYDEQSFMKDTPKKRSGFFLFFKKFESLSSEFPRHLKRMKELILLDSQRNLLQIAIPEQKSYQFSNDDDEIKSFKNFLKTHINELKDLGMSRVTLIRIIPANFPKYYNFTRILEYEEQIECRHVEPSLAYNLELSRLSNYNLTLVPTTNRKIHLYYAEEKGKKGGERLFARSMVRGGQIFNTTLSEYLTAEAEDVLLNACDAIELALADPRYEKAWNSHIFMNFIPEVVFDTTNINQTITKLALRYADRIGKLKIGTVEITGKVIQKNLPDPLSMRFITTNPTGQHFELDAYIETRSGNDMILKNLFGNAFFSGKSISAPYDPSTKIEARRLLCRTKQTTYVYDLIDLFFEASRKIWKSWAVKKLQHEGKDSSKWIEHIPTPDKIFSATELILAENDSSLIQTKRSAGQNDIGMIAWKCTCWSPEYPNGREFIIIANDLTFQIGSFGIREDKLFKFASAFARKLGIPRIFFAANAGARIGLAEEVKGKFQIAWKDANDPTQGFEYLYVSKKDFEELSKTNSILAEPIGNDKYKITSIIGKEDGLGVENLKYAGLIAAETSKAYENIFTITQVSAHTIGIGAYLVRLGQRMIQNRGPVILTGSAALNKVLGRPVYTSNDQLGGPQIMHPNGISHRIVESDLDGILDMLKWLSFIPKAQGFPVPITTSLDPIERNIEFIPTKVPYNPRDMLNGCQDPSDPSKWISGFFDKGSFIETLADWGRTVVVGRARLGGIPMGVIAVETRTMEKVEPADPATSDSQENTSQQAGQVWFPDSAYKTSQAMRDFDKGEELPLFIFANWRGFSGGLRDLYGEILKFGSYIVDALNQYRQPVFVYIPRNGELRGGAWAVVDPTINPEKMEMYCDSQARGGILEATGVAEVKFRVKDCLTVMHLRDQELKDLVEQKKKTNDKIEIDQIEHKIKQRESKLLPIYEQVAIDFVDLQDSPGRMKAKECVRDIIEWPTSRTYFYYRIKRRLTEDYFLKDIQKYDPSITLENARGILISLFSKTIAKEKLQQFSQNDQQVLEWFDKNEGVLEEAKKQIQSAVLSSRLIDLSKHTLDSVTQGLSQFLSSLDPKKKAEILETLQKNKN